MKTLKTRSLHLVYLFFLSHTIMTEMPQEPSPRVRRRVKRAWTPSDV